MRAFNPDFLNSLLFYGSSAPNIALVFPSSWPSYYGSHTDNNGLNTTNEFRSLTSTQKNGIRIALDMWSNYVDVKVTDHPTSDGKKISFGFTPLNITIPGEAYFPVYTPKPAVQGDVFFNTTYFNRAFTPLSGDTGTAVLARESFQLALHEIGHALGLDHAGGNAPVLRPGGIALPDGEQNVLFSVMAYDPYPSDTPRYAITPMLYDIAKLQEKYGANTRHNAGDTVYTFTNTATPFISQGITAKPNEVLMTLWDGDGDKRGSQDTINASGVTSNVKIDLRPGEFSAIGTGYVPATGVQEIANPAYNVGIAFGTIIENAVGGSGNDVLVGNDADNLLSGGLGNDTYILTSSAGFDTITDTDNQGAVKIDGSTLAGNAMRGDGRAFLGSDASANAHSYVFLTGSSTAGGDLLIDGAVLIKNWKPTGGNQLGLSFGSAPTPAIDTSNSITGDRTPIDFDPATAGVQTQNDALGNVQTDPQSSEPGRADRLYDSAGNDYITGGGGSDTINGSRGGDDRMEGGAGRDDLYGGTGNDVMVGNADGDVMDGWTRDDFIYADSQIEIAAAITQGNTAGNVAAQGDWLAGRDGADVLIGSAARDVLSGGDGADILVAGAGDDDILGDTDWATTSFNWTVTDQPDGTRHFFPTSSQVHATQGEADLISAGNGNDHVWGEFGHDVIYGEAGDDSLYGGEGNDVLVGGDGNDVLDGGADADYLLGGAGIDVLYGAGGDDRLDGGGGTYDQLMGGSGNNTFIASAAVNDLYGDAGDDTYLLTAGTTNNIVDGLGANTFIFGNGVSAETLQLSSAMNGDSLILNFGGSNVVSFASSTPHTSGASLDVHGLLGNGVFQYSDGTVWTSKQILERAIVMTGTANADNMLGTSGHDRLSGGLGNDSLRGASGQDDLMGGAGDDTYRFELGDGQDSVIDVEGVNTLVLGDGIDASNALLTLMGANLVLTIAATGDQLTIADWNTSAAVSTIRFADGTSWTKSQMQAHITSTAVVVTGSSMGDSLVDGPGNDQLSGNAGDDYLYGSVGNDTLDGGAGNDQLSGGAGNNVYVFGFGDGQDRIVSFEPDYTSGRVNTLRLKSGISPYDIVLHQVNTNSSGYAPVLALKVSVGNDGDEIEILGFFNQGHPDNVFNPVQSFEFAEGQPWSLETILTTLYAGTDGDDVLYGTNVGDSIQGGFGNDTLLGLDGDDTIRGGEGNDSVAGGLGIDTIDYRTATEGVTVNLLVTSAQTVSGSSAGVDTITEVENVMGSLFNDVITGDAFANRIDGFAGNDWVSANAGADYMDLGDGNDTGGGGADDDTLLGGNGDDSLTGGDGNDILAGEQGNDTLSGSDGVDTADFSAATSKVVAELWQSLATEDGYGGQDSLLNIENLIGSAYDDLLSGTTGSNVLSGMAGNDAIYGGEGNDTADGGLGNDTLSGGLVSRSS